MKWSELRARVDAVRNQLALEFGASRLTFYVAWAALVSGFALGVLFSFVVALAVLPSDAMGLVFPYLFVGLVVTMGGVFAFEFLHPIGRREYALQRGLSKGTMKVVEPPPSPPSAGGSS